MKRHIKKVLILSTMLLMLMGHKTYAANDTDVYTVKSGDSLWIIAVKYQVGLSEIISANPQFKNPHLIYPGDKVTIPLFTEVKGIEQQVVDLVNAERGKKGLPALKVNWEVARVARYKSEDMINKKYFSHTSPTYGSPFDMLKNFGVSFRAAGENIAYGQKTAKAVMDAWMNSTGHRENILNTNFTHIGVGYAVSSNGTPYWTQLFIKP